MAQDSEVIEAVFQKINPKGQKKVSKADVIVALQSWKPEEFDDSRCERLFEECDSNQDGFIEFEEFEAWLVGAKPEANFFNKQRLKHACFRATRFNWEELDRIINSYVPSHNLSKPEFLELWQCLEISRDEAENWFKAVDVDKTGTVSFKSLITALIVCSAKGDVEETAKLLMRVHDKNGDGLLNREEFACSIRGSIALIKATFYPALADLMKQKKTPEGTTWAEQMIINHRFDLGKACPADDEEVLKLVVKKEYPEAILDAMADNLAALFRKCDQNRDGSISLEELARSLTCCEEFSKLMFPQHVVRAMVTSYAKSLDPPDE